MFLQIKQKKFSREYPGASLILAGSPRFFEWKKLKKCLWLEPKSDSTNVGVWEVDKSLFGDLNTTTGWTQVLYR